MSKHRPDVAVLRRILGRMVVFSIVELALFVAIPAAIFGWQPVVVMGNSMQPHLRPGDALLISGVSDIDEVEEGTIVTFRRVLDEELVTHRVVSRTDDGQLITKGDANNQADSDPVDAARLIGSGRLLVPMVGLPAERPRQFAPVLAVAAGLALVGLVRPRRRGAPTVPTVSAEEADDSAQAAAGPATSTHAAGVESPSAAVALPDLWVAHTHRRRWPWPWSLAGLVLAAVVVQSVGRPPTFVHASFAQTTANTNSSWQADVIDNPTGLGLVFTSTLCLLGPSMTLTWTASGHASATSQDIHRSVDGGPKVLLTTLAPGATSHVDTAVACGRTYVYDVVTVAAFGATTWESAVVIGQNEASEMT